MKVQTFRMFQRTFEVWYDPSVRLWFSAERLPDGDLDVAEMSQTRDMALMWVGVMSTRKPSGVGG